MDVKDSYNVKIAIILLTLLISAAGCTQGRLQLSSFFQSLSSGVSNAPSSGLVTGGSSGSQALNFPTPQVQVAQVHVGTTYSFTSNIPVTWSLAPGSAGTIDPQSGVYVAPPSITPHNQIAGCQLLPNDHIYNTRIDNLPVVAADTTYLNTNVVLPIGFEVSFPENDINSSAPLEAMTFSYTPQYNGNFPSPLFPNFLAEGGYNNVSQLLAPNTADHHMMMMNTQTCQASEMYMRWTLAQGAIFNHPGDNSDSGVQYGLQYDLKGGTDAAGMYVQPLSFRFSELRNCIDRGIPIQHAGRFTLSNGYINSQFRWPATAQTNEDTVGVPYGARIRLRASFDTSSFSPAGKCMLNALKTYGLIMADGGDNFGIQTMADIEYSLDTLTSIGGYPAGELQGVSSTNFEVVDESLLEDLNPASPTYQSGRVNPSNPYVVPSNFATVIATSQSNSQMTASVPVTLQAVTVGTADRSKYVMAGTPAIQLQGWVNGGSSSGIHWSMSPAVGSLSNSGMYTAPSSVTQPTMTTITATSLADQTQSASFNLNVMPGPAIRVMADNASGGPSYMNNGVDYGPDANGNIWWGGRGAVPGTSRGVEAAYYRGNCNYLTQCTWPTTPDIQEYYNQAGDGNDMIFKYSVPNGSYTITLMFGMFSNFSTGDYVFSVDSQGAVINPVVGGVTVNSPLDMCTIIGSCKAFTPGHLTFTVTVTDNNLYFAVRGMPTSVHFPEINAFSIVPN